MKAPGHREIMSCEQTPVFHQPQILSISVESIQPPFWLATTCISLRLLLGSANFEAKPLTRRRACAVRDLYGTGARYRCGSASIAKAAAYAS